MTFMSCIGAIVIASLLLSSNLPANAAEGEISVQGTKILRDGKPWVAKGVTIVGIVAPQNQLGGPYVEAHRFFGPAELDAAKLFGADVVRFQVSQGGTDPQSRIYSEAYVQEVQSAITLARSRHFSVIVSLQGQQPSGLDERGMPGEKAVRAWGRLAPLFASDRGVMLELYNEPAPNGPDAGMTHDWAAWQRSMQPIVDEIRTYNVPNVLLVDGLYWAQMLQGAPRLSDPLSQIVYAEHPYYSSRLLTRQAWDQMFGNFSESHPVMVTEWNAVSMRDCNTGTPKFAADLLAYLREHQIGLVGWALDLPGTLITNYKEVKWTSYDGFQCGSETRFGAGELIHHQFAN
jgi:hypothetical protein